MERVSKISAEYLSWVFHADYKLGTLYITTRICILNDLFTRKYPSPLVPFKFSTLRSPNQLLLFYCLHKKDILSIYTFESSRFKNNKKIKPLFEKKQVKEQRRRIEVNVSAT